MSVRLLRNIKIGTILRPLRIAAYALPVALMGGLYLLAFYPAIMTTDSLHQWEQVVSGKYTDWHPILSTLLIGMARFFWDSPASMALFQIIALSLVAGWGFAVMEDLGAPRLAVWFACLFFAISPLNGAFVVTIWKDIPYGIAVLALMIMLARIVMSNGRWLTEAVNCVIMGLLLAFCMLVRYNGIAVAVGIPLILAVCFRRNWRPILGALILCVVVILLVKGPLYQALHVEKRAVATGIGKGCQMRDLTIIAQVAAHMTAQTPLKDAERDYLNEILPLEPAWHYDKYSDFNILYNNNFDWSVVNRDPRKFLRCYTALTLRRPWINIRHCISHSAMIWCPWKKGPIFNVGVYCTPKNRITYINPPDKVPGLQETPKLSWLSHKLARWIIASQSGKWNIWQSAVYLYLFLMGVGWAAWRARNARILLLAAPLLFHSALIMVLIQAPDSRYQYPVFLITYVFWVGLFFGRFPTSASARIPKPLNSLPN